MIGVLSNRIYRHLFLAQVIALIGTGLATVALGLLAFDLAGEEAGAVLGTALAIKMVAYVGVAPLAAAFAERLPRRAMLVFLDLVRAGVAVILPFVTEVWQVYVSDLRAAIRLGGLHADFPGDDPRRAAGREALHKGTVALASRL